MLRKNPGFTTAAVLVMALGIGANTAIFSMVSAVLLRPLPYAHPDRIVQLWHVPPQSSFPGMTEFSLSPANFLDWQKQNHAFERMALYSSETLNVTGSGKPEAISAATVTDGFFDIFGPQPLMGRTFLPEEDQPGKEHEIVLSYVFWRDHFGADPHIVGKEISFNGAAYTVIGVMDSRFRKPGFAKAWVPMALNDQQKAVRGNHNMLGIALLKPGVTVQQAQAELDTISRRLEQEYPKDDKGWGAKVVDLHEQEVGDLRTPLFVLLGAVAFVLLIACANVANLVLARTLARKKEIAIRSALGASRAQAMGQVLIESVLLSVVGGALGLIAAHFGIKLMVNFFADRLPKSIDVGLNGEVLAFTLGISVLTGVLAGLVPAWKLARGDIQAALKQGLGRTDSDTGGLKTRNVLVICEVALSLVLLIGAGLMIRTLWALENVDPGFDEHNVLTLSVMLSRNQFNAPDAQANFFNRVLDRVRSLPGVQAAGIIDSLPLQGGSNQPFTIEGRPVVQMSEQPEVAVRVMTPGYLPALRVRLLRGRDFTDADRAQSPGVALISESMAKRFWGNEDPIGRHISLTFFPGKPREIVGIVGDVKQEELEAMEPKDSLYYPLSQLTPPSEETFRSFPMSMAVRTGGNPSSVTSAVTNAIHEVDKETPVADVMTMQQLVEDTFLQKRFSMLLLGCFAGLALLLATIGIYSVLAYAVRRRVKEIGLRMALGATIQDVARMVVVQGMKPTLTGVVIGLVAALALGRVVASLIYGVSVRDFTTFISVSLILVTVGFAASLLPAYRATRIEPVRTLREE
jgi:predicted permease